MTAAAQALKPQLDQLSETDRAEIASYLIERLEDEGFDLDSELETELDRREQELDDGEPQLVPAEVVFARLRERTS